MHRPAVAASLDWGCRVLFNTGLFSYNGIPWTALYKSKLEARPIKDSAGRAVVFNEYTLQVSGHVTASPGTTTDLTMTLLRQKLQVPAAALIYSSKGFGALNVNVAGGSWDAAYGPWPELLAWDPVGNDQGALVTWRCKVLVPCEPSNKFLKKGILEWNYEESWDIDDDRYTVRTISGHLVIAATRPFVNSTTPPDRADNYRELLTPAPLVGFRRKEHYKESEDKRRIEFSYTDEELPAPLPPGTTRADVHHRFSWKAQPHGAPPLTGSLSGSLTVPAGQPKSAIWDGLFLILFSKLGLGRPGPTGALVPVAGSVDKAIAQSTYLLRSVEVDDDVFGRGASFRVEYWCVSKANATLSSFLAASQLWQPVGGVTWAKWQASLLGVSGPRGNAGLVGSGDVIVDLCSGGQPVLKAGSPPGKTPYKPPITRSGFKLPKLLLPQFSWLWYELRVRLIEDDRAVRHKPLKTKKPPTPVEPLDGFFQQGKAGNPPLQGIVGQGAAQPAARARGSAGAGVTSSTMDLIQQVGSPSYNLRLEGRAARIGYPIPTPRVKSVGGIPLTQAHQDVQQQQAATVSGLPIYTSTWVIDYILPDDPQGDLPMPVNPAMA